MYKRKDELITFLILPKNQSTPPLNKYTGAKFKDKKGGSGCGLNKSRPNKLQMQKGETKGHE